ETDGTIGNSARGGERPAETTLAQRWASGGPHKRLQRPPTLTSDVRGPQVRWRLARHPIPEGPALPDPRDAGGPRRPHAAGRAGAGDLDRHRDRGLEHEVAAPLASPAPPRGREPPRPRRPLAGDGRRVSHDVRAARDRGPADHQVGALRAVRAADPRRAL